MSQNDSSASSPSLSPALKKLHQDWLEDLEIGLGRSAQTVRNYDHYLTAFYAQQSIAKVSDITLDAVREFRRWLSEKAPSVAPRQGGEVMDGKGAGVSPATQNYYLIALRQFLKYLVKRDVDALSPEKVELAKLPERDIDVLYPEEIDALLAAAAGNSVEELRDTAIMHVLFSTGMRISELVKLNRDDIRNDSNEMPIRGKGNKVRVVFLSPEAREAIEAYIKERGDMDPALFVRHKKGVGAQDDLRISARSIQRLIKKHAAKSGIMKDITPHTLRHSFATDLLANGADVRQVQELLGHSSITTTQIYTHLTDTHLRDVHEKFHRKRQE